MSLALTCAEGLHAAQMNAAVALFVADYLGYPFENEIAGLSSGTWTQKSNAILVQDASGMVSFELASMPCFLRQSRLQGVDVSHRTIAIVCQIQIELDRNYQYPNRSTGGAGSAFSPYAARYLRAHTKVAEKSSLILRASPRRRQNANCRTGGGSPDTTDSGLRTPIVDQVGSRFSRLEIEDEDFVWIDKTQITL